MLRISFCICALFLSILANPGIAASPNVLMEVSAEVTPVLSEKSSEPSNSYQPERISQPQSSSPFESNTDLRSLLLGVFFGLMVVMAIYNLLLYFSLKDKAYLLYVGTTVFAILSSLAINGLSGEYLWPENPDLDRIIYITWAGLSMFCSSRFAAVFLELRQHNKRLDQFMWVIAYLSLLLTVLSLFLTIEQITPFGRWLVLLSFPSYMAVAIIAYRRGFKPALFYIVAWIPYVMGLVVRTMHGAGWLPTNQLVLSSIELGGALEIVLLSFALAYRIKGMKRELIEKELEKEQFKTKLLEEQKSMLENKVNERTKELSEANATKDKFFSIIAHDLRSPMIALQGVGQKLEYFIKKDRQEKLLEMGSKIDQSIDQLNHLLNNLLNWATSQTGAIAHHPETFDIKGLVQENLGLYQSLAKSKEIELVDETIAMNVYADTNTTSTIIRNILSNAIKFTKPRGKVVIGCGVGDKMSFLSIRDEGPGMKEDMIDSLFTDIKSVSGSRGEKGFGLGLKLCKEFAEMNKGGIKAESAEGVGTTFTVSLPNSAASVQRTIEVA